MNRLADGKTERMVRRYKEEIVKARWESMSLAISRFHNQNRGEQLRELLKRIRLRLGRAAFVMCFNQLVLWIRLPLSPQRYDDPHSAYVHTRLLETPQRVRLEQRIPISCMIRKTKPSG